MKKDNQEVIKCSLCGRDEAYFFSRKNDYDLYRCKVCKLLFVYPIPKNVEVYDKTYFTGADLGFGYVDYDADKIPMIPVFEKYLDMIFKLGATKGTLLDVGSATGFFMDIAKKRGFEVVGVELSNYAAEIGRAKGLTIVASDLKGAHFNNDKFDVITMFDVLEHVPNPKDFLLEAKRILKPGGFLVINTPNGDSVVARVLGSRWHLIVPPEHLYYFSPKNVGDYLTKNGFNVKVATSIGKRFTLQYIFKTLYRWQKFPLWDYIEKIFAAKPLTKLYIPLNTHDNFFLIAEKNK
ncbi:MAG: class I SAM-dependent methyltransferase [Minisyncoccia bacterium]